jgi:hypothetical protein
VLIPKRTRHENIPRLKVEMKQVKAVRGFERRGNRPGQGADPRRLEGSAIGQ